jgi:hypothetical protein
VSQLDIYQEVCPQKVQWWVLVFPILATCLVFRKPLLFHYPHILDIFYLLLSWNPLLKYCHVSGFTWRMITGSGLDDWIYWHLYITWFWTTANYSAIAILHNFQFTVAHALGCSVFTSHILATDLLQSRCNFKSHMKSSWHCIISFLPFLRLPIPRLDSLLLYTPLYSVCSYYSCPAEHFL